MPLLTLPPLVESGARQMALDEALLSWVMDTALPDTVVVRAYQWATPTLSLGVHQSLADSRRAYAQYAENAPPDLVRRPTGGRGILHGADASFAIVTNRSSLLRLRFRDSYCHLTGWLKAALDALGVAYQGACETHDRAYTRSPLCFETQTAADILSPSGEKVAGSAQLRRKGGLLQHGAVFLDPEAISLAAFSQALCHAIEIALGETAMLLDPQEDPTLSACWDRLTRGYEAEAGEILAKLATTSGSHLVPASE